MTLGHKIPNSIKALKERVVGNDEYMVSIFETLLDLFVQNGYEVQQGGYPWIYQGTHGLVLTKVLETPENKSLIIRINTGLDLEECSFDEDWWGKITFEYARVVEIPVHQGEPRDWHCDSRFWRVTSYNLFKNKPEPEYIDKAIKGFMLNGKLEIKKRESRNNENFQAYLLDDVWKF